ncbi:zinc-dependent metalloprotease [Pedobacter sp. BS3]|uniref:zinc-dependent metalloprotease n=1 Tax=Pedobacter sp. BS3 TaxID=2567937 RepID=UPI001659E10D|nr:zinc-dependent metalloprotease [Pedobacter sp. BS3]
MIKKILHHCLCVILVCSTIESFSQQNLLYEKIQQAKVNFTKINSVFKQVVTEKQALNLFINPKDVSFMDYKKETFASLNEAIILSIPFKEDSIQIELLKVPASFYNYEVVTNNGQRFPANKQIKHYRGVVKGNPNSLVAISFLEDEVIGLIVTEKGNFNLSLDKRLGKHIVYNDKNLKDKMSFKCGTRDNNLIKYNPEVLFQSSKLATLSGDVCVRLYLETEYDIFQTRGSIASVESFISAVFNQVATLYQNENIEISLSELYVWTTTDPYTSNDLSTLLQQFQTYRTTFNGALGQLLTFRSGVGGGLAAGFDGLCNSNVSDRLSVAMLYDNYASVPTYSWTVQVITHEFGHLFGSRHTHACVWNGNNTAIDGCAGGTEGGCSIPGIPSGGGTIMSYCHLQSVGINFNLGFGSQPGNVIRNSVANANCLCECAHSTISGPSYICDEATYSISNLPTGATVTWTAEGDNWAVTINSPNSTQTTVTPEMITASSG